MRKKIIFLISALILFFVGTIMFILFGNRYKGYSGKRTDLYTEATNSVLWNIGHSYGADREINSKIDVIEEDDYGRTMFIYNEKYYSGGKLSFSCLLISQQTLDNFVYYYEDYNYLIKEKEVNTDRTQSFTEDDYNKLKLLNDWNKELDLDKCVKKEITNQKSKKIFI